MFWAAPCSREADDDAGGGVDIAGSVVGARARRPIVVTRSADQDIVAGPPTRVSLPAPPTSRIAGEARKDVGVGIAGQGVVEARAGQVLEIERECPIPPPIVFWAPPCSPRLTVTPPAAST